MAADGSCGSEHIVAASIVYGSSAFFSKGSLPNSIRMWATFDLWARRCILHGGAPSVIADLLKASRRDVSLDVICRCPLSDLSMQAGAAWLSETVLQ